MKPKYSYLKRSYVKNCFLKKITVFKQHGVFLSGIKDEGEYKSWWSNGNLYIHCFYKDGKKHGEYEHWSYNGKLKRHYLYKDNTIIKDYLK